MIRMQVPFAQAEAVAQLGEHLFDWRSAQSRTGGSPSTTFGSRPQSTHRHSSRMKQRTRSRRWSASYPRSTVELRCFAAFFRCTGQCPVSQSVLHPGCPHRSKRKTGAFIDLNSATSASRRSSSPAECFPAIMLPRAKSSRRARIVAVVEKLQQCGVSQSSLAFVVCETDKRVELSLCKRDRHEPRHGGFCDTEIVAEVRFRLSLSFEGTRRYTRCVAVTNCPDAVSILIGSAAAIPRTAR